VLSGKLVVRAIALIEQFVIAVYWPFVRRRTLETGTRFGHETPHKMHSIQTQYQPS
jgi:hypothetical protein